MNVEDSSQDFFALSSQWCADTARILLVAELNGKKGAVFDRRLQLISIPVASELILPEIRTRQSCPYN